jgi:hypothetical protein
MTLYSGHVCVYYASILRCWHLVWIQVRTDHPCLGVGCHTGAEGGVVVFSGSPWSSSEVFLEDSNFVRLAAGFCGLCEGLRVGYGALSPLSS